MRARTLRSTFSAAVLVALSASASAWVGCGNTNVEFPASSATGSGGSGGGAGTGGEAVSSTASSTVASSSATASSSSSSSSGTGGSSPDGIISTSTDSILEAETHVAVGANNVVVVAWIAEQAGGNSTNGYVFSTSGGASWTPVQQLASPNGLVASDPVLAFDQQNNCYMTWIGFQFNAQGNAYNMHVYVAKAPAGTTTFGAPVEIAPAGTNVQFDKPWITVTNKNAVLVTYAKTSTGGIYAARSADGGATWSNAVIVEDGNFRNLVYPCVSKTNDRIWAAYHAGGGIGLRWSDDDGVTWPDANKSAVAAQGEQPAFDDPTCAADGNDVWISYGLSNDQFSGDASPKLHTVRVAHSPDGGSTVDFRVDAHDAAAAKLFMHPALVRATNGTLHLVYYAGQADQDAMGTFRRSSSTDGGHTWQASTVVRQPITYLGDRASPLWLGDYVGSAWSGGDLYMSYVDNAGMYSHIAFTKQAAP
ncbi:MAG: sialidase family protein [Minicystis sp.]